MSRKLLYGCMHLGGSWDDSPIPPSHQTETFDLLDFIIGECGITDFDHADIYCRGKSEKLFGSYLKDRNINRSHLFIQSKCGIQLGIGELGSSHYCFEKSYIIDQVNKSIDNLQCEFLDALLLHRPDPLWHPEEVAETFEYLLHQKLVKSFGVSNFSIPQLTYLQRYFPNIFANQVQFSLGHSHLLYEEVIFNNNRSQITDTGFFPYHQDKEIEIQIWGPLDQGKYLGEHAENIVLKEKISTLSKKYNTSPEGILLAWILTVPGNLVPILGSLKRDRVINMLQAFEITLDRKDWYDLWILALEKKLP
jgi:predicted oxidoreductase